MKDFDRRFRNTNRMINGMFALIGVIFVCMIALIIALAISMARAGPDGIARSIGHAVGTTAAAFDDAKENPK